MIALCPGNPLPIFSVIPINPGATRLRPPSTLSDPERTLFASLVTSNSPQHFKTSDLPLLCQYVQAAVLSEQALAAWCPGGRRQAKPVAGSVREMQPGHGGAVSAAAAFTASPSAQCTGPAASRGVGL